MYFLDCVQNLYINRLTHSSLYVKIKLKLVLQKLYFIVVI